MSECTGPFSDARDCPVHRPTPVPDRDGAALRVLLEELVQRWRTAGARLDTVHATMGMGWKACADELDALLVTGDRREP